MWAGAAVVIAFFGLLGGWAAIAPLQSAAIASGVVTVESNQKTIKHLEGGIIRKIFVTDGDIVKTRQILIELDDTQARASHQRLLSQRDAAWALEARLISERDSATSIQFRDELYKRKTNPETAEIIRGQKNIFKARRESLNGQGRIMIQRKAQIQEEIIGLKGQIRAEDEQLRLIGEEENDVRILVNKGLMRRPRLLSLERQAADIGGARSRNIAAIARAKQQITESELRIVELRTSQLNQIVEQLGDVQAALFDVNERIHTTEDTLARTKIRAPSNGVIVGLSVHTPGGVIASGQALMNIVPTGSGFVIDAQIDPNDIDVVHAGLSAEIRLTAYSQRNLQPLPGTVITVSADRLTDARTGAPYFLARIALTAEANSSFDKSMLYPGMQAEVLIITGKRTALDYFLRPIGSSFNRAFRED
ncbi:MAG: HlyD family type I secretion periplasmic adaptor subunit [Alphaproteobacteria bacterium]|nr:HlyD family type I secretion periplasmic adaptor subunit [Alphaproteobacteria bacterium]